jgi:hypothetical protein
MSLKNMDVVGPPNIPRVALKVELDSTWRTYSERALAPAQFRSSQGLNRLVSFGP